VLEHLVGGELDHGAADVLILVADVDVARVGPVGGARESACQLGVLEQGVHEERLPGLDVRADPDDQVGIAVDAIHGSGQY